MLSTGGYFALLPCAAVRGRDREKRGLWVKTAVVGFI